MVWGDQHLLFFPNLATGALGAATDAPVAVTGALMPAVTTNDTTKYVTDPVTGLQVPPDNTDPNIYIYWPGIGNLVNGAVERRGALGYSYRRSVSRRRSSGRHGSDLVDQTSRLERQRLVLVH